MVGRHHKRIEAARAAQGQPATKALLRRRSKVERKIDHLQDLGMRKARYRGRRKTRLQALFAATVANFKRLAVLDAQGASLAPKGRQGPRKQSTGERREAAPSVTNPNVPPSATLRRPGNEPTDRGKTSKQALAAHSPERPQRSSP